MANPIFRAAFTTVVVAMIFLPIPPTTIIGIAIANHPRTRKYMIPQAATASQATMRAIGSVFVWKFRVIGAAKEKAASERLRTGRVYL